MERSPNFIHWEFLSTLPARGATDLFLGLILAFLNFYPRSPRGERPSRQHKEGSTMLISIHAPREGSDREGGRG